MSNKNANIMKVAEIVENSKVSLVDLRPYLEKVFPKKSIDFSFAGVPHFTIKTSEGDILILNKKYVSSANAMVGEIAIGY